MNIYQKLNETKESILTHSSDISELEKIMKSEDVRKEIDYFINNDITNDDVSNIELLIDCAQFIYNYTGDETGMSDSEYDILYEKLSNISDNVGITVPVISNNKTVYHKYKSLRGTLDKIYALTEEDNLENKSRKSLDDWIKSSENRIKERTGGLINLSQEEVYCFPKFDGVSCIFEFNKHGELQRALTRGYTETNEAQDITHLFKEWVKGPFDNAPMDYGLKTEIMMSNEDFEKYNETYGTDYKQSRSIVSSIINSDEADERVNYLQIMPLRMSYLDKDGNETLQELVPGAFNTPYLSCRLCDRELMRKFAFDHALVNGLRCDGMVIYLRDPHIQKILGRENNKQKFEVAFKFTEEVGYSKIEDIKFTIGLFGRINPIAVIKPIKLKGNTIENISLGSIGRFQKLGLSKGDKVKILYDIIPYIVFDDNDPKCKKSSNEAISMPDYCPECGEPLELSESGDILYCINNSCPCKKKGKILNYFNKMHIDGISYATIDIFYNEGYLKSIKDVYKLESNKKKLSKIPGFGPRSIQLIIDEINNHKDVPASQMLGSLGIEGVSTKMFEKVLAMISFDELLELSFDDKPEKAINVLTVIPGIKDKTAKKIVDGLKDNEKLIEFLDEELIIKEEKKSKDIKFSVVFTKVRDKSLEDWTESVGGIVKDSLSKDVSILVVPVIGVESSKVTKAQKYNIPIVAINDYKDYVEKNLL